MRYEVLSRDLGCGTAGRSSVPYCLGTDCLASLASTPHYNLLLNVNVNVIVNE